MVLAPECNPHLLLVTSAIETQAGIKLGKPRPVVAPGHYLSRAEEWHSEKGRDNPVFSIAKRKLVNV
jgi:hypothetical protein